MSDHLMLTIYKKYQGLTIQAQANGRSAAIRLFCLQCMGDNAQEVKDCTARLCPLWKFRMGAGNVEETPRELKEVVKRKRGSRAQRKVVHKRSLEGELGSQNISVEKRRTRVAPQTSEIKNDPSKRSGEVIEFIASQGILGANRSQVLSELDLTEQEWREAISELLLEGKVSKEGNKRSTRYFST